MAEQETIRSMVEPTMASMEVMQEKKTLSTSMVMKATTRSGAQTICLNNTSEEERETISSGLEEISGHPSFLVMMVMISSTLVPTLILLLMEMKQIPSLQEKETTSSIQQLISKMMAQSILQDQTEETQSTIKMSYGTEAKVMISSGVPRILSTTLSTMVEMEMTRSTQDMNPNKTP